MPLATRTLFAVLCVALGASACGGSPTRPTETSTAMIAGMVRSTGEAALASSGNPATGMTVTIVGTNLSSTVLDSGYFQLIGVPSGNVRLLFRDAVVNATLSIANVGSTQLVQIEVQVSGTSATVVSEERSESKVELCHRTGAGVYHSITVSDRAEPAHRAHGDGKIGEAVPGQSGKVFGSGCGVN